MIEDEPANRTTLAELLRSAGHAVLEAENAEQGLGLLDEYRINLIILDFILPDMNGLQFIGCIRQRLPKIPIILISGYMSQRAGDAILGASEERTKYFAKPVRPTALELMVQTMLSAH